MREIKFRAWESDNQSVHFSYEYEDGFVWEIQPEIQLLELRMMDSMPGGEYHEQKEEWVAPNQIIMQYTGLKDKNGVEIYEGDIVYDEDGEYSKTVEIQCKDELLEFFGKDIYTDESFSIEEISGDKVIGNIYQNPELLK